MLFHFEKDSNNYPNSTFLWHGSLIFTQKQKEISQILLKPNFKAFWQSEEGFQRCSFLYPSPPPRDFIPPKSPGLIGLKSFMRHHKKMWKQKFLFWYIFLKCTRREGLRNTESYENISRSPWRFTRPSLKNVYHCHNPKRINFTKILLGLSHLWDLRLKFVSFLSSSGIRMGRIKNFSDRLYNFV